MLDGGWRWANGVLVLARHDLQTRHERNHVVKACVCEGKVGKMGCSRVGVEDTVEAGSSRFDEGAPHTQIDTATLQGLYRWASSIVRCGVYVTLPPCYFTGRRDLPTYLTYQITNSFRYPAGTVHTCTMVYCTVLYLSSAVDAPRSTGDRAKSTSHAGHG